MPETKNKKRIFAQKTPIPSVVGVIGPSLICLHPIVHNLVLLFLFPTYRRIISDAVCGRCRWRRKVGLLLEIFAVIFEFPGTKLRMVDSTAVDISNACLMRAYCFCPFRRFTIFKRKRDKLQYLFRSNPVIQ